MRRNITIISIIGILALTLVLCVCIMGEEKPQPSEQQLQCEHEWVEVGWNAEWCSNGDGVSFNIYCPKCQWERRVSYTDWNKIQADMEYKANK